MNMELLFIVGSMFFTGYSVYAWKKYDDEEYFWLSGIGLVVVVLFLAKLMFIGLLPENTRAIVGTAVYWSWLLVLAGLGAIEIKKWRGKRSGA